MSLEYDLTPFYIKVDNEDKELNGWYGDVFTPVQVNWNELSHITRYRLKHAHDIESGKCMKSRTGLCK